MTASAVESQIVGYKTDTLTPDNFTMIALAFNNIDGTGIDLNGSGFKIENHSITEEPDEEGTDYIQIWDGSSGYYDFYYAGSDSAWISADGQYLPFIEYEGFENGLPAGSAAWYNASGDAVREGDLKMLNSGAVETDADVKIIAPDNFTMLANPYPVATDLNNPNQIVIANHSVTEEPDEEGTDYIQIWDGSSGYYDFYYAGSDSAWISADGQYIPFIEYEGFENGLPAGSAFWYNASGDCVREGALSIEFVNPL